MLWRAISAMRYSTVKTEVAAVPWRVKTAGREYSSTRKCSGWLHRHPGIPARHRNQTRCFASATDAATDAADGEVIDRELHEEARSSYLSYAMSVMVGRALPDVRDGLKPVHRRLLFSMDELKLSSNKPFRKSARVVGDVLGKYHPHGDQAIYDSLVRMAQPFAMGERLIDGHGNFGSVDNDPAAAMRYTECRLQKLSEDMLLKDLDPSIVKFTDNFDGSCQEPSVLPARIPQLLVNGSQGIAVGIATKVPPHNLREVVAALQAYIANPSITDSELQKFVQGPDFPTGAILLSTPGIQSTYETGKGSMTMRSKVHVETGGVHGTRSFVVVTELPYQIPKSTVIEEIAALVEKGTLTGISDVQDESDRTGMRIVIELKRGVESNVVVNNLFKHSRLQTRFSANMVALVDNIPEQLTLRRILETFFQFRYQVIEKRAEQQLQIRKARRHIVEGFLLAVDDLDNVVKTIRSADDGRAARDSLQQQLSISEEQADAVLNMSLRRLTGLAVGELRNEENQLKQQVDDLSSLLADPGQINSVMDREAQEISDTFGRERRTFISRDDLSEVAAPEELVPDERCLVIFSTAGHIKRVNDDTFSTQKRGGRGKTGGKLRENDAISNVLTVMSHDHLVCIATDGSCHTVRAFDVPERPRTARGMPMGELLPKLKSGVTVAAVVALRSSGDLESHIMLLTVMGKAKRIDLQQLRQVREGGRVMALQDGDTLCFAAQCNDQNVLMVACSQGKVVTYLAQDIPERAGRATQGVRAKNLKKGHHVVGACLVPSVESFKASTKESGPWLLLAASDGLGKRVPLSEFRMTSRTAAGVIGIKMNPGVSLVNVHVVEEDSGDQDAGDEAVNECLLASSSGMMSRIALKDISVYGRLAKGLRITRLAETDALSSITPCKYRHFSA